MAFDEDSRSAKLVTLVPEPRWPCPRRVHVPLSRSSFLPVLSCAPSLASAVLSPTRAAFLPSSFHTNSLLFVALCGVLWQENKERCVAREKDCSPISSFCGKKGLSYNLTAVRSGQSHAGNWWTWGFKHVLVSLKEGVANSCPLSWGSTTGLYDRSFSFREVAASFT